MKFLSKLLGAHQPPVDARASAAADHIDRALAAAGLDGKGPGSAIRDTIDKALASAGLQPHRDGAGSSRAKHKAPDTPTAVPTTSPTPAAGGTFLHASFANVHGHRD